MIDTDKVGRRVAEGAILGGIVLVCLSHSHHVTVIETKRKITVITLTSAYSSKAANTNTRHGHPDINSLDIGHFGQL